jgi:hypothetical protein
MSGHQTAVKSFGILVNIKSLAHDLRQRNESGDLGGD